MTVPLLETRNLCKMFDHEGRRLEVLRGVDLVIHERDKIAVMGQSGAGKSTLLHILGTLDAPTSGVVLYRGKNVFLEPPRKLAAFRNESIGFMFQFHHLLPEFTAVENVMMPLLIRRLSRRQARERAMHWLDAVGLTERVRHRPGELSGGEQQRVALARALVGEPVLLLADEPTGNLDRRTSEGIHELFVRINEEHGTAILVVTHNAVLAGKMPRMVRMLDGLLESVDEAA